MKKIMPYINWGRLIIECPVCHAADALDRSNPPAEWVCRGCVPDLNAILASIPAANGGVLIVPDLVKRAAALKLARELDLVYKVDLHPDTEKAFKLLRQRKAENMNWLPFDHMVDAEGAWLPSMKASPGVTLKKAETLDDLCKENRQHGVEEGGA
jgi:hypothetical protein